MIPHGAGAPEAAAATSRADQDTEPVTVVLATRNRRDGVLHALTRLRAVVGRAPIVVVDDGSTDGTAAAVRAAHPDVTVLQLPRSAGAAAARNAGVQAARSALVAFSDDDSWWAPGALERAAAAFAGHPRLGLVAARVLVGEDERLDPVSAASAASPLPADGAPGPRVLGFVACGAVVRRDAYLEVGGFPEEYEIGGEEEPLALALTAAGWQVAYLDDVVAHHHPATVGRDDAERRRRVVRNDLWTTWRYRRAPSALRRTATLLVGASRDAAGRAGAVQAVRELPRVLRSRRPLPVAVERQRRTLERAASAGGMAGAAASAQDTDWLAAVGRRRRARLPDVGVQVLEPAAPRLLGERRCALVMITYDRAQEVVEHLERIKQLPERPAVVVVDNGSRDDTAAVVRRWHPWVELLVLERNVGAAARTLAVERLSCPYVAFADDDTWWEPGSLERAADLLDAYPDVAVVTARILVEPGGREDPVVQDMRHSPLTQDPDLPGHPLFSFLAGASMVRRDAYLAAGGFEPRLHIGGEEELLAADLLTAGWKLRYIPELTVHHAPSRLRDAHQRRAAGLRNTLWTTWLRRPPRRALWRTAALLRQAPRDLVTLRAVAAAVAGLPWVLREHHPLPDDLERQHRLLDHAQLQSHARRYVS